MFKKLKEKFYNREMKKLLNNVEFEDFSCYGRLPYPLFFSKNKQEKTQTPFVPESEFAFKLAIEKLNLKYFEKISIDDFRLMVQKFCSFYHFNESVIDDCINIYNAKQQIINSKNTPKSCGF